MSASLKTPTSKLEPCVIDGVKFGSYQNCLIKVWEANGTNDYAKVIRKVDDMVPVLSEQHPEGIALIVIAAPGCPIPSGADRKALEAFFARWSSKWRAVARVAEGSNLWSIAARAAMTALVLMKRAGHPENTFATGEEAAEWMSKYITRPEGQDEQQTSIELKAAILRIRSLTH